MCLVGHYILLYPSIYLHAQLLTYLSILSPAIGFPDKFLGILF